MKKLILILLLALTAAPVYAEIVVKTEYQGMWACMSTKSFGYKDGKQVNYIDEKFFLKIKGDTLSYSGDPTAIGRGKLKIVTWADWINASSANHVISFNFNTRGFVWARVFNYDGNPETYNRIGTCEKFDDPE